MSSQKNTPTTGNSQQRRVNCFFVDLSKDEDDDKLLAMSHLVINQCINILSNLLLKDDSQRFPEYLVKKVGHFFQFFPAFQALAGIFKALVFNCGSSTSTKTVGQNPGEMVKL